MLDPMPHDRSDANAKMELVSDHIGSVRRRFNIQADRCSNVVDSRGTRSIPNTNLNHEEMDCTNASVITKILLLFLPLYTGQLTQPPPKAHHSVPQSLTIPIVMLMRRRREPVPRRARYHPGSRRPRTRTRVRVTMSMGVKVA